MINFITKDQEVPDNGNLLFTKRVYFQHNDIQHQIVAKVSKKVLFTFPSKVIYSTVQLLDDKDSELACEFYTQKLTKEQVNDIVEAIQVNPNTFIDPENAQ